MKPKSLVVMGFLALAFAVTTGCENKAAEGRNNAAELLREASAKLVEIAGSAVYPMSATRREALRTAYGSFLGKYSAIPAGALTDQEANLNALAAEAHLALTKLTLGEAGEMEEVVDAQLTLVLQKLGSAMELNIMAEVAGEVDFSVLKATIDEQGQLSRRRRNDLRMQAQQIQKQIADLEGEIKSELVRYDEISNRSAVRREEAFSSALDDQRGILEAAAALSRQADTHQVRAAFLGASLNLLTPTLETVQTRIAQTETELISFETSRGALIRREEVAAQNAVARRVNLEEMASTIANELRAIYIGKDAVRNKFDEAIASAERALSKATSAGRSPGGETRIIQAYQGIGSAHWRRAQFLERVANVVQRMADEKDVLGRGDNDRVVYESIQPDLVESHQKAGEAFRSAAEATNALPARDVDEETRMRLLASLNEAVKSLTGSVAIEEDEAAGEDDDDFTDDGGFANRSGNTGALGGDPRDTLRQLAAIDSIENAAILFELIVPAGDAEREFIEIIRPAFDAIAKLENACKAEFGSGLLDQVADPGAGASPTDFGPLLADPKAQIEEFKSKVETLEFQFDSAGTTAWVTNDPALAEYLLIYVDGTWKIEFDFESGGGEMASIQPMIASFQNLVSPIMAILGETTDRVAAGDFPTLDAVGEYLGNAVMSEFMKMMGEAGGSFGGGFDLSGDGG